MRLFTTILSVLLGLLFIFSGVIKLIDPSGTAIKLEEYFTAFSTIATYYKLTGFSSLFLSLDSFSTALSLILSTLEIVLGFSLLISFKPRLTTTVTFLLLVFFGALTAYSASCDPNNIYGVSCVTDCGCFGDFLSLKPIESFYKDLVFLTLCFPILLFSFSIKRKPRRFLFLPVLAIGLGSIMYGIYTLNNLPVIDFRPYKIKNDIIELRKDGKMAKVGYVMEKGGNETVFEKYPFDQGYSFVKTKVLEDAVAPSVKDFYLFDSTGTDVTENILSGHFLAVISYDINTVSKKKIKLLREFLTKKRKRPVYCFTASSLDEFKKQGVDGTLFQKFFMLDQTVLKAMIRTNPGVMEIKNGVVLNKWTLDGYHKEYVH